MNNLACVKGILKGSTALTDAQLNEIIADVRQQKRVAMKASNGVQGPQIAKAVADRNAVRKRTEAAIQRKNAAENAIKQRVMLDQRSRYATKDNPNGNIATWSEAMAVGSNKKVAGARESAVYKQNGYIGKYTAGFVYDLEKAGLIGYVATRLRDLVNPGAWGKGALDDKIVVELHELSKENGQVGKTGSDEAKKIAAIIYKWQETARGDLNRLGAYIGKIPGYIVAQTHDMVRVNRAGFDAWHTTAERVFGNDRTYENLKLTGDVAKDKAIKTEFWRQVYNQLSQGEFFRVGDESGFTGPQNLAKKVSQHRTLHPSSAELWIQYNDQFGTSSLMEAVFGGLVRSGKTAGLMEKFGTNPKAMFDSMIEAARQHDLRAGLPIDERIAQGGATSRLWNVVDGTVDIPSRISLAYLGATVRAHQSITKLGGAVLASIPDVSLSAALIRDDFGDNLFSAALENITSRVGQMADAGKQREMAMLMHVGIDTIGRDLTGRVTSADATNFKAVQKATNAFFKLNLLGLFTDSGERGLAAMYNTRMALRQDTKFADLEPELSDIMQRHGIGAREWDIIREYARHQYDSDTPMLVADKLRDMPLKAIDPLIEWPLDAMRIQGQEGYSRALKRAGQLLTKVEKMHDQLEAQGLVGEGIAALREARDYTRSLLADDQMAARWALDQQDKTPAEFFRAAAKQAKEHERILAEHRKAIADAQKTLKKAKQAEPGVIEKLGEAAAALDEMRDRLREWPQTLEKALDHRRELAIQELESKLNTFYTDRVTSGVIRGSAREKLYATQGIQAGTPHGEAWRMIMQFKQYPMAFVQQILGRYAEEDRFWSIPGALGRKIISDPRGTGSKFGSLILMTWAMGYAAMALKDMAKGRTPRDPKDPRTWAAAFIQGGGAGIYGDYLFARVNRFGGTIGDAAMGPGFSTAFEGIDLALASRDAALSDLLGSGEDAYPDVKAFNYFKANTPFLNLFYTRAALDYLILYDVQEALRPGSLRRMERSLKTEQKQEFLLPPSQYRARPFTGR